MRIVLLAALMQRTEWLQIRHRPGRSWKRESCSITKIRHTEAAEAFKQAIALDPTLAEAHFRLGLALEALNKAEEAEKEYKFAVESYKNTSRMTKTGKMARRTTIWVKPTPAFISTVMRFESFAKLTKIRSDDPDIFTIWEWPTRSLHSIRKPRLPLPNL